MSLRAVLPLVAALAAYAAATLPSSAAPPLTPGPGPAPDLAPAAPPIKPVLGPSEQPPEEATVIHEAHKEYRTRHCANWLRWSNAIANEAQERADQLAKACRLRPSDSKYGENLWSGTPGGYTPQKIVDSWYLEGRRYNYKRPGHSKGTARFTQLVWAGSKRYGCATAQCKKTQFWVCFYDPPGNMEGEFERNVFSPSSCKE
jgi:uncharacterized protein YkwD